MKLKDLIKNYAQYYVDIHESDIYDAIMEAMEVDMDEVATSVVEQLDMNATEAVVEEVLKRL